MENQYNDNNQQEHSHYIEGGTDINLSKYTQALINVWKNSLKPQPTSPSKISVSQTVSFAAFLYEKLRNMVEFREEHLIRRAAIERIIKRRMILNSNGRDIAESLIRELLWARYHENNTIGEDKIAEIQETIDKYFFLRNELNRGRSYGEQEKISQFILEILSCEIEEKLSPKIQREAFINYVYQILRNLISPFSDNNSSRDVQVYIAVEKTLGHSDLSLIRYHLLKLLLPEIISITWKSADLILPKLYESILKIDNDLKYPYADRIRNIIKKHTPPFLILRDIFEQNPQIISQVLINEETLKYKVDEACRRRYQESSSRLKRTAVRSFIYILLTKVIFAFLIEVPYDLYIAKQISYIPIGVNIIFPPLLMTFIILTVTLPGDDNTRKIFQLIKGIIDNDPDTLPIAGKGIIVVKRIRTRSLFFSSMFSLLYFIMYFISFGSIIYLLTLFKFSPVSQGIFIFFVTLVTFFAFRVIQITQEYQVVDRENLFTPIVDFYFLPIIRVGQWLSGEILVKFNILIFIFDFIIEMPFKAIVEVFDEWFHFIRLKKEEII